MFRKIISKKPSIAKKLLLWFLLISLLPLTIFGYIGYQNAIATLKEEVTNNLIAIADSKARQIENYILEKERDVAALTNIPTVIDAMEKFSVMFKKNGIDAAEYHDLDKELRPFLTYYQESFGYYDLFIISSEGDIIFTVIKKADSGTNLKTGPYKNTELAKVFNRSYQSGKTAVSDFKYYAPSDEAAAFIAAPVLKEGSAIGAIAFQIKNEEAYELMQDYTGLGTTGEILIGTKIGNEAVFANPLRHDPRAAFTKKIPIGSKDALPIQEAVQGRKGSGLSIDYRGKEILAVWRYLPSPRWGMVVKIDTKEAFTLVARMRNWSLIIGVATILAVALLALIISKSISDPIMKLHEGTEIIGGGNLDYRVGTDAKDEIGQLSRAFDKMTESLKTSTVARDKLIEEITERKWAEEKIREQSKFLRNTIESLTHPFYVIDTKDYTVKMANSAAVTAEALGEGTTCYALTHRSNKPCAGEEHRCPIEEIKKTNRPAVMEHTHYDKDGNQRTFEVHGYPIFDAEGNIYQVIEYSWDITERKQVEKELQKHHSRLEKLVEKRTAELTGSNEQLRREIDERKSAEEKVRFNESRLEALLKLSEMKETTIKEIADFVLEEGVKLTQSKIGFLGFMGKDESILTIQSWSKSVMEECIVIDKPIHYPLEKAGLWGEAIRQRKPVIVNNYSSPNPHKRGYPEGHVNLLRVLVLPVIDREQVVTLIAVGNKEKEYDEMDLRQLKLLMEGMWEIIERSRSEKESRRLRAELAHLTRVATISELTTSLAHELNQPLTAIMSNAQAVQCLLKSETPDMSEVRDALTDIINDNRRAGEVIRSLRKLLKQEDLSKIPVDINKVVQETISLVNSDFVISNIALTLDLSADLPSIVADRIQLQQVILNLILNGIEAMRDVESGSRELIVRTRYDDPSTVTVVVQDSGTGIDAGKLGKVFDPFFTTKPDGLGMGLSINRTIIETHGGRIWATQNPEGGAIFSFNLPVYKE
jgi:PAS domain S-box-containing protein